MTKQRGARQLLEQLRADLAEMDEVANLSLREVKFDPEAAYNALVEIRDLAERVRRRLREDLEPMLERNDRNREAASVPDRIASLEQRVDTLEAELRPRIVPLRKSE